jgi:putative transposase
MTREGSATVAYWRLHYHVVWATHRRTPWLTGEAADIVEASVRTKIRQLNGHTHAVGVMPDHVHLAVSLPPDIALAVAIGQIKGASSYLVGQRCPDLADHGFQWQGSFGIVSFSESSLPQLIVYVENQAIHHRDLTLHAALERCETSPAPDREQSRP